jgi:hypothetical protein
VTVIDSDYSAPEQKLLLLMSQGKVVQVIRREWDSVSGRDRTGSRDGMSVDGSAFAMLPGVIATYRRSASSAAAACGLFSWCGSKIGEWRDK